MTDTDAVLVRRVLAGDGEAFGVLVDRHHARCLRIAVHLLGDRADAEDAVQETLIRAYRHLGRYRGQDKFGGWLTRILVNQCRTLAARTRRPAADPAPPDDGESVSPSADAAFDAESEAAARRTELARALAALPADQREAVVLRYADELSYDAMAALTGVTVGALKMRVQRACRRLRALLTADAGVAHD